MKKILITVLVTVFAVSTTTIPAVAARPSEDGETWEFIGKTPQEMSRLADLGIVELEMGAMHEMGSDCFLENGIRPLTVADVEGKPPYNSINEAYGELTANTPYAGMVKGQDDRAIGAAVVSEFAVEHLSEITIADSQYDTAMNILKYVHQYFTYDFVYTGAPEYYALRDGRGVCEHYTKLYTAMCKAAGINAESMSIDFKGLFHVVTLLTIDGVQYWADSTNSTSLYTVLPENYTNPRPYTDNGTLFEIPTRVGYINEFNGKYYIFTREEMKKLANPCNGDV